MEQSLNTPENTDPWREAILAERKDPKFAKILISSRYFLFARRA